jgi:hypothetical protein
MRAPPFINTFLEVAGSILQRYAKTRSCSRLFSILFLIVPAASAQWLKYPSPGISRISGEPDAECDRRLLIAELP